MLNVKTLKKHADAMGVEMVSTAFTDGRVGYFIPLERVDETGKARYISTRESEPLMRYLKRYGIEWKYRGYYTSILVYQ